MSAHEDDLAGRAAALRREFDRAFAEPPRVTVTDLEDFLAVRAGPDRYVLRVAELAGLFADKKVLRLPTPVPELLGIAGFRSAVVPVYDLRALLGYGVGAATRWLALTKRGPIALAFDAFEGHLRVPREQIASDGGRGAHLRGVLRTADSVRPIVDLVSVLDAVERRARAQLSREET